MRGARHEPAARVAGRRSVDPGRRSNGADPPPGAGATKLILSGGERVSVGSSGTFSATFKTEGSLDGTTWYDLDTTLSTVTFKQYANPLPYIRVNMTAYTSGDLIVKAHY